MWNKEDAAEVRPDVPVVLPCGWTTKGKIALDRNRVWVYSRYKGVTYENDFSWDAVLQALNDTKGIYRLPLELPSSRKRPGTPLSSAFTQKEWEKLK